MCIGMLLCVCMSVSMCVCVDDLPPFVWLWCCVMWCVFQCGRECVCALGVTVCEY